jgi:hypothetical protein
LTDLLMKRTLVHVAMLAAVLIMAMIAVARERR